MSDERYEIIEATPIKRAPRQGAGRKAKDNPFEQSVREIAGQTDADGDPLARAAFFSLNEAAGETLKQRKDHIRRLLTRAGKLVSAENHGGITDAVSIALVVKESTDEELARGTHVARFWDRYAVAPEDVETGESDDE